MVARLPARPHPAEWRLTGWSPDWYAGFPAGVFYFPLPSLLVVVLDVFLPYNVAFKLVTAIGPIMLPIAAYAFARGIGARWPAPPLFAVATLPYSFYTGYTIWGGNLASTLAGEFSFCIAIGLGLFFMGALARALDERTGFGLPAVLLAATVMSHLIVTVFVAVGAVVIWLQRRPRRNLPVAAAIGGVAALITAIWSVPLVLRLGYTTDMGWTKEPPMGPNRNLLPNDLRWAFILAALAAIPALFHTGAEVVAYLRGRARPDYPQTRATRAVLGMTLIFGVSFVVIPEARLWNARILPFYYLMVMFLAASAVASLVTPLTRAAPAIGSGLWRLISEPEPEELAPLPTDGEPAAASLFGPPEPGVSEPFRPAVSAVPPPPEPSLGPSEAFLGPPEPRAIPSDDAPRRRAVPAWLVSAVVVVVALGAALQYTYKTRSFLPAWIRWNYSGYEAKPAYPEFREVITTMAKLPPGRALWEPSAAIDHYGTTLALELLPHFTNGRIASMEGLYFESAATTPYHFVMVSALAKQPSNPVRSMAPYYRTLADFELGVAQMRDMGVSYYMAQSDEAKAKADASPGLKFITETGSPNVAPQVARWKIYQVLDSPLVEPLKYEPVVMSGAAKKQWLDPAAGWFDDVSALDRPLTDGGPAAWAHAPAAAARFTAKKPVTAVTVSNVKSGDDSVSFDVSQSGVPVLVKTSYFPNWQAKGAHGPWRATPNEMVVVPTGTHVSLHYGRTPVDWAGMILRVFGLLGLAGLARWKLVPLGAHPARRRRVGDAPAVPPSGPAAPTGPTRRPVRGGTGTAPRFERGLAGPGAQGVGPGVPALRSGPLWGTGSTPSSRPTTSAAIYPDEIDEAVARRIGNAFAGFTGARTVVVGHDMRAVVGAAGRRRSSRAPRSPAPTSSTSGWPPPTSSTSPSGRLDAPGAMFTASHNPAQYNGIKLCRAGAAPDRRGRPGWPRSRPRWPRACLRAGRGRRARSSSATCSTTFAAHVRSFVDVDALAPLKVVADTANGMGGLVVPRVFDGPAVRARRCCSASSTARSRTIPPTRSSPRTSSDLQRGGARRRAPTSGSRSTATPTACFLVDDQAEPVSGSTTTAIVAEGILDRHPGETVVHNLICSKAVPEVIRETAACRCAPGSATRSSSR